LLTVSAATLMFCAVLAVAYANGANDTFKGVATVYGGGSSDYRTALVWATGTTFSGSLVAGLFAHDLVAAFSGKGFVDAVALADPSFVASVAFGAATTVFVAALAGIPISTTHSLMGALVGAGLVASGSGVSLRSLGSGYVLPLAVSPFLAIFLVIVLYLAARMVVRRFGLGPERCICVGAVESDFLGAGVGTLAARERFSVFTGDIAECRQAAAAPRGGLPGIEIASLLRKAHFLSAGAVSFARGTNDAPKIVGIALLAGSADLQVSTIAIAIAMALGGLLHSQRVARTVSRDILSFDEREGVIANLATSCLVISASTVGVPVSTTHVSIGSLFGLGMVKGNAHWRTVGGITLSWFLTLPVAMASAALFHIVIGS